MATWSLRKTSRLTLSDKLYQEFKLFRPGGDPEPIRELPGVSAVNMFVGANHSGKSRFLRSLAKDAEIQAELEPEVASELNKRIKNLATMLGRLEGARLWGPGENQTLQTLSSTLQAIKTSYLEQFPILTDPLRNIRGYKASLLEIYKNLFSQEDDDFDVPKVRLGQDLRGATAALDSILETLPAKPFGDYPPRIYIPVLRGLRLFNFDGSQDTQANIYQQRTERDYFNETPNDHRPKTFTGYSLYYEIRNRLLGNRQERILVRDYEQFLSETFFEGKSITLTAHREHILKVTIGEEERAIHDVGDGLQSAIILTFEPFVRREQPCLFFIEEPELFLHPGLQRHILDFYLNECSNHVFFLTTHSNHLLGMSFDYDDISIYNFQRDASASEPDKPRFLITPVSRGDHSSLELLGVRNSSVFLVNATIWVEGITDRRYMRKFLELYRKHCETQTVPPQEDIRKLEEDIHYAFVEYGGANLKHWAIASSTDEQLRQEKENDAPIEIRTLCARAFLIRDDDETSSGDRKKSKKAQNEELERSLGERFARTPGREIENLLPPQVIEAILREKNPSRREGKPALDRAAYREQRLGAFLDQESGEENKWGDEYGTLKRKNEFCSKTIEQIDKLTFLDLGDDVQAMVKKLCRFLVEQNQFSVVPGARDE